MDDLAKDEHEDNYQKMLEFMKSRNNESKESLFEKLKSPKAFVPNIDKMNRIKSVHKQLKIILDKSGFCDYTLDVEPSFNHKNLDFAIYINTFEVSSENISLFQDVISNIDRVFIYPRVDNKVVIKLGISDIFHTATLDDYLKHDGSGW